jgi:hypothetical protein
VKERVAALAALKARLYVKVLIHMYFWKGCQDCQTLSLARLALFNPLVACTGRNQIAARFSDNPKLDLRRRIPCFSPTPRKWNQQFADPVGVICCGHATS